MAYLDVILLFVFQTSIFDSPNSLYLKIVGFIRCDSFSFSSILKFIKKNYYDRYYDILHPVARIIRQCLVEKLFLLFSVYLPSWAFYGTEFQFEFELRIPTEY